MSSTPAAGMTRYPESRRERDRWIVAQRALVDAPERSLLDPGRPYAFHVEQERAENGEVVPVATLFLTNRECPWRCLMCDLWRNTLRQSVPPGAIPHQIDYALERLPPARQIKLYNSGSFFDRRAIPVEDYGAIAARVKSFERVIVECHPLLVGDDCWRFCDMVDGQLEVAMGLETVHPEVWPKLNKGMTLDDFAHAATVLQREGVSLRVFILVKPPFMDEDEALYWAERSLDFAFDCGATAVSLIPTRSGNGAVNVLEQQGHFSPPKLSTLAAAADYGLKLQRGRIFVDMWDLEKFSKCPHCFPARAARFEEMNLHQELRPPMICESCGESC